MSDDERLVNILEISKSREIAPWIIFGWWDTQIIRISIK
jgi:hypothetical protein